MFKLSENQKRILNQAAKIQEKIAKYDNDILFNNCAFSKQFFSNRLLSEDREVFSVAFLDNQHKLIVCEEMFLGTYDAAPVYPREIAKRMLELNSAAIIVSHNHPSGISTPSDADIKITKRIKEVIDVIGGRLLDHVIVAKIPYSFAENGIL